MDTALKRLDDGTIELTIRIPWSEVGTLYQSIREEALKTVELPGFRKGKAPKELAEKQLDKSKLFEEVIKEAVPKAYSDSVKEHSLRPIIYPKLELVEATEGKDWTIRALTCERPVVTLGDYKTAISDLKAAKHKKIWLPGEEKKKDEEEKNKKPTIDEIVGAVLASVTVAIPQILLEQELNRLLSGLIDQTKKLGLTVEQYLTSTHRTAESLKSEYQDEAGKTLTLEFALEDIADKNGILVSDDDIDAVIKTAKTEEETKALERDRYYLASILRRQKTLDFIANL